MQTVSPVDNRSYNPGLLRAERSREMQVDNAAGRQSFLRRRPTCRLCRCRRKGRDAPGPVSPALRSTRRCRAMSGCASHSTPLRWPAVTLRQPPVVLSRWAPDQRPCHRPCADGPPQRARGALPLAPLPRKPPRTVPRFFAAARRAPWLSRGVLQACRGHRLRRLPSMQRSGPSPFSGRRSSRRLGELRLSHRLAIPIPDIRRDAAALAATWQTWPNRCLV